MVVKRSSSSCIGRLLLSGAFYLFLFFLWGLNEVIPHRNSFFSVVARAFKHTFIQKLQTQDLMSMHMHLTNMQKSILNFQRFKANILGFNCTYFEFSFIHHQKICVCPSGALWGARWKNSVHVCVRLRSILQTWRYWRGEDPHEHHRPRAAHWGVEGSGERGSRGGAVVTLKWRTIDWNVFMTFKVYSRKPPWD